MAQDSHPASAAVDDSSLLTLAGALGLGFGTAAFLTGFTVTSVGLVQYESGTESLDDRIKIAMIVTGGVVGGVGTLLALTSVATLVVDQIWLTE